MAAPHDHSQYRLPDYKHDKVHPDDVPGVDETIRLRTREENTALGSPAPTPRLRLVDSATGELLCENCQRAETELRAVVQERDGAEKELRRYRAIVERLQNAAAKDRQESPLRREIREVFDKWKECTGHPNSKLTDDRFDAIEKWLKHYKAEEIYWACAYIAAYPYSPRGSFGERFATGKREDLKDGIDMICSTADRFERWANMGYKLLRSQGKIEATTLW